MFMSGRSGKAGGLQGGPESYVDRRQEFAYKLGEVARLWRGLLDRQLKPTGLSFLRWSTLARLSRAEGDIVQKDLALLVGTEGPTMVGVLDRLVKSGFVERRVSPRDRRANTVHLTRAGHRILRDAEKALREVREVLLEGVSETELEDSVALFELIVERERNM